jgi:hypothetical protein
MAAGDAAAEPALPHADGNAASLPELPRLARTDSSLLPHVSLLDPVVRRILDETNAAFLRGSGTVHDRAPEDRDGGA